MSCLRQSAKVLKFNVLIGRPSGGSHLPVTFVNRQLGSSLNISLSESQFQLRLRFEVIVSSITFGHWGKGLSQIRFRVRVVGRGITIIVNVKHFSHTCRVERHHGVVRGVSCVDKVIVVENLAFLVKELRLGWGLVWMKVRVRVTS